jgi:tRNA-dihydrouridine synthase 3
VFSCRTFDSNHKSRYLLSTQLLNGDTGSPTIDDDAAEAAHHKNRQGDDRQGKSGRQGKRREKNKGQNTARNFGTSRDEVELCSSRMYHPEFSPAECAFGDRCKFEHDLRRYLTDHKRADLTTFNARCPVWECMGTCRFGWKCRFVTSHMTERMSSEGKPELILLEDKDRMEKAGSTFREGDDSGTVNIVSTENKILLTKKKFPTPTADKYLEWMNKSAKELEKTLHSTSGDDAESYSPFPPDANGDDLHSADADSQGKLQESRAQYTEPPLLPSEKRRLYFGADTPVLAPLTTQGNLPFRRLCCELGAQLTYSEMAMSLPIMQGSKSEWALMKAHESEALPPNLRQPSSIVKTYDNSRDLKFGAQIAANKPWQALKATEVLTALCPHLRVVDLNCGCPIDLVFRDGAGSALLDHPSKLEKIIAGMNVVSGEVPITVKIRTGTRDGKPTAEKLAQRLVLGGFEAHEVGQGASGVAAITLHGRSRQQRYTRSADWSYISECAALVKSLNEKADALSDTARETDERSRPASGKVYFLGNGDCYSHEHYNKHVQEASVDSVMIARGALMKPWIFEEIEKGQYIDKSANERLTLVEKFARYGLEAWGSDERGVGQTRRFLLEWLSFACRYVPVGILEYLPPNIQDRPPAWKGRNELETLLGSDNYKDWIKIR